MRYFLKLAYRGAPFCGWQVQPHDPSVQETLERALTTVVRRRVAVTGAGRTDTGVNARMMVAHFDLDAPVADPRGFIHSLNGICGRDIAIEALCPVADSAHARFDATSRTYKYFVHTVKSPFVYPLSWHCQRRLDVDLMNRAAAMLTEFSDFTSFSKLHTDTKTNLCRVDRAIWQRDGDSLVFTVTADRFLRNMVRAIVGTLVDVGCGKMTLAEFRAVVERRDRCAAGESMPGHALFLWDITYPYPLAWDNGEPPQTDFPPKLGGMPVGQRGPSVLMGGVDSEGSGQTPPALRATSPNLGEESPASALESSASAPVSDSDGADFPPKLGGMPAGQRGPSVLMGEADSEGFQ